MAERKLRSDSVSAALKAAQDVARGDLQPPAHIELLEDAREDFRAITRARARDEWSEMDLIVAVQLANVIAKQRDQEAELELEGIIIINGKGTQIANPRAAIIERLAGRQLAYMRSLQMGGRVPGTAGDKRTKQGGRELERKARLAAEQVADEDLLA